ncbi:probable insulin-like peptide 3 [Eurosta solidaginis]|uniref:probable insulin-like peptide 3 n=1 Tax=Eurosta solidaginis TaxID=178769 RepID=UPI0035317A6C
MVVMLRICALLLVLIASLQMSIGQKAACGPALDQVLSTICVHGFNAKFKRTGGLNVFRMQDWDDSESTELENENALAFPYPNFPFLTRIPNDQIDALAKTRRRRQGVYDECCGKGCTYNEIMSYCNKFKA